MGKPEQVNTGLMVRDMSFADYLSVQAASSSGLHKIATTSPFAFANAPDRKSKAKRRGTIAHLAILQPELAESEIIVRPESPMNTNAGKEVYRDWMRGIVGECEPYQPAPGEKKTADGKLLDWDIAHLEPMIEATGLTVAMQADWDAARHMRDSIWSREHTRSVIEAGGIAESSIFTEHQEYGGISCKIRPDWLVDGLPMIVDLKSTRGVGRWEFLRSIRSYGYDGQAWFYLDRMRALTGMAHQFIHLAVENEAPFDCALYELTDAELAAGEARIRNGLLQYQRCTEAGIWPGANWDWGKNEYDIESLGRTL